MVRKFADDFAQVENLALYFAICGHRDFADLRVFLSGSQRCKAHQRSGGNSMWEGFETLRKHQRL
jgi:hypothetical protein